MSSARSSNTIKKSKSNFINAVPHAANTMVFLYRCPSITDVPTQLKRSRVAEHFLVKLPKICSIFLLEAIFRILKLTPQEATFPNVLKMQRSFLITKKARELTSVTQAHLLSYLTSPKTLLNWKLVELSITSSSRTWYLKNILNFAQLRLLRKRQWCLQKSHVSLQKVEEKKKRFLCLTVLFSLIWHKLQ